MRLSWTSENGDQRFEAAVFRWNVLLTEKNFDAEDIKLSAGQVVIHPFENSSKHDNMTIARIQYMVKIRCQQCKFSSLDAKPPGGIGG